MISTDWEDLGRKVRVRKGQSLLVFEGNYTAIDLETTGLSPEFDEIIEMAAVRVRGWDEVARYQTLVRPENGIDPFIQELTGITNEMVADAPPIGEALPGFLAFLEDDLLLGHNVQFDVNFLYDYAERLGLPPVTNDFVDTLRISRRALRELPDHRLQTVCAHFGVAEATAHRALADSLAVHQCYGRLRDHVEATTGTLLTEAERYNSMATRIKAQTDVFDENSPIYGVCFAFTGKLDRMPRKDAMQMVVDHGGLVTDGVVKETNYLVLGNNDLCKAIRDGKSNKQKKAEKMKLRGFDIEVIPEDVFYDMLEQ